jgi:glycosyltransferase involved in cell wall biosynthesis
MHVLVVVLGFPYPGNLHKSPFIKEQVLQLCKRVERVTVLCPTKRKPFIFRKLRGAKSHYVVPEDYCLEDGKCQVIFPKYLAPPGYRCLSWTKAQWCRVIRKTIIGFQESHPVSLIHAHSGSLSAWASLNISRRYGIPLAVTYHGSEVHTRLANRQMGWEMCRDVFEHADLNLPVSRDLETILRSQIEPKGRCETLFLGVDQSRFIPSVEPKKEKNIVFIGRITKEKGFFDLLSALKQVKSKISDVTLTVVGEDRTQGEFLKQIALLNLEDSVCALGALPNQAIPDIFRKASLFCLPSYGEGTPVSIMEAMSCGLPVIATRVGGIPDIVMHNQTGLLIDKGNIQELTEAIQFLFWNPVELNRMGNNARAFADEHFDGEKCTDRLVKLYEELIASASPRLT